MAFDEEIEEFSDTGQVLFLLLNASGELPHVLANITGRDLMNRFVGIGLVHWG